MLTAKYALPSGSTGAMLRAERERGSQLGREADRYTSQGKFFPDELALEVVRRWLDRHTNGGFVLDGFPRTRPQAIAFDAELNARSRPLEIAVSLEITEEEIRRRVTTRLTCESCGATFGAQRDDLREGDACPKCGAPLGRRNDDTQSALTERLAQEHEFTAPVLDYYAGRGLLARLDANGGSDKIFTGLCALLETEAA